jgi:hypothetical protein
MAAALCDKLYAPGTDVHEAAMREANSTSGFLRLAQEYLVAFGQNGLNDKIRALVPDIEYEPAELHKMLLSLPWTDVHTTNWDTLLERAARAISHIDYDVVRTHSEIPASKRPRIIKLHGSFPAHEPFVFTEDDYRRYPTTQAPFVNLVQQSLMESVLCLIGFSGDDPNFLHWTGWVRDNLGYNAPKVYLVGWLDLSTHRRRLLEDRNVVPVDLSKLRAAGDWPPEQRHRYATEWFLRAISVRERFNAREWPFVGELTSSTPLYLGELPIPVEVLPMQEHLAPEFGANASENLETIYATSNVWKVNRGLYPKWFVAPLNVRDRVWHNTQQWIDPILQAQSQIEPIRFLDILDQLTWRLNLTLAPLLNEVVEAAKITLDQLAQVDVSVDPTGLSIRPSQTSITGPWCRVALMVARTARTSASFETAELWLSKIAKLVVHDPELYNAHRYELCLLHRDEGELGKLKILLEPWVQETRDTSWAIKQSGLLAQLGMVDELEAHFTVALKDTRTNRRRDRVDYLAFSREGWLLWYESVMLSLDKRTNVDDYVSRPFSRWRELALHDCDAASDFDKLHARLRTSIEKRKPKVSESIDFNGQRRQSMNFENGIPESVRLAYQVFELADATGLPASIKNVNVLAEGLRTAIPVLEEIDPWLCSLWTIRSASAPSDEQLRFFSQVRIAQLSQHHVSLLKKYVKNEIAQAIDAPFEAFSEHWSRRISVAIEVLARLAVRYDPSDSEQLFTITLQLLQHPRCVNDITVCSNLQNLFRNVIHALPQATLTQVMPLVFGLPISANRRAYTEPAEVWPQNYEIQTDGVQPRDSRWNTVVQQLLVHAREENMTVRTRALHRFIFLDRANLLTRPEKTEVARSIWAAHSLDTHGWPRSELLPAAIFALPEVTRGQTETAFRSTFMNSQEYTSGPERSLRILGAILNDVEQEAPPLKLNAKDLSLINVAINSWTSKPIPLPKGGLALFFERDDDEIDALHGLIRLLPIVDIDATTAKHVWKRTQALSAKYPMLTTPILPLLLPALPDYFPAVVNSIRESLVSDSPSECTAACLGLWRWLELSSRNKAVQSPPIDMIREVGYAIARRRPAIIISGIEFAEWLIKKGPTELRTEILQDLETGLSFLLEEARYDGALSKQVQIDLPRLRTKIGSLTATIRKAYTGTPEIFQKWADSVGDDPLAKVRLASEAR